MTTAGKQPRKSLPVDFGIERAKHELTYEHFLAGCLFLLANHRSPVCSIVGKYEASGCQYYRPFNKPAECDHADSQFHSPSPQTPISLTRLSVQSSGPVKKIRHDPITHPLASRTPQITSTCHLGTRAWMELGMSLVMERRKVVKLEAPTSRSQRSVTRPSEDQTR